MTEDTATTGGKLIVERRGGVLVLTLNRPQVRNAIDTETAWAVSNALDQLEADPALTAAVLTGAGGTFCAGMDLKAFLAGESPSVGRRGFAGIVDRRDDRLGGRLRDRDRTRARSRSRPPSRSSRRSRGPPSRAASRSCSRAI
jgi:enoyl-CoA hydratase/carnithine racemase